MTIVFDVGGTRMRVAASQDGITLGEPVTEYTPQGGEEGVARFVALVRQLAGSEPVHTVCGGIAGWIEAGTVKSSAHLRGWEGCNVRTALAGAFPQARVEVENDALLGAFGEARAGAGRKYEIVGYLTFGTGIGGARILRSALHPREAHAEPGKQILEGTSAKTFEQLASGPVLLARYGVQSVAELSDSQVGEAAHLIAEGAYNAIVHWEPDVLVLGGGVIAANERFVPAVTAALAELPTEVPIPPIVDAQFGDTSVLMGALELAKNDAILTTV